MTDHEQLPDGIYFGLGEDVYHGQRRLSASGIKQLRISPATFWADSWLNPSPKVLTEDQQRRQELAKVLGRAYHAARLESETFHERFVRLLDKADFDGVEGFVAGGTAYGDALGALGETKKRAGESVADQAERLAAVIAELIGGDEPGQGLPEGFTAGPIWDVELAQWEAERGGRVAIPALNWAEILQDMDRIAKVPEIHALLSGGFAEVSILWTDAAGHRWKTRLDYLRADGWADFKTFANAVGKNVQQVIMESFRFNRYHVQAAVQRNALEAIRNGQLGTDHVRLRAQGEEGHRQMALIDGIAGREAMACDFIWQEKGGVPNLWAKRLQFTQPNGMDEALRQLEADGANEEHLARARRMQEISAGTPAPSQWLRRAIGEVEAAVQDFETYSAVYPAGEPWLPFNPVGDLTDADFPPFWLEGNA